MTSKAGSRSNSASQSKLDDADIDALKKRRQRIDLILDGAMPLTEELLAGYPPRNDDIQSDVMAYVDHWRHVRGDTHLLTNELFIASENARINAGIIGLSSLRDELEKPVFLCTADAHFAHRCDVWSALLGDTEATARAVVHAMTPQSWWGRGDIDSLYRTAWAIGVVARQGDGEFEAGDTAKIVSVGLRALYRIQPLIEDVARAESTETGLEKLLQRQREAQTQEDEDRAVDALKALIESGDFEDDGDPTLSGDGIIVVPAMPDGVGGQREVRKSWKALSGLKMPVLHRGDVAAHKSALTALYPHASDVIDIMLRDLAPRETVRFRPTLIVGKPGSGKTSLLRAIADQIGLPVELNSLAGVSDGAMMGTSAQWATTRESVPLQLIKRSRMASVAMIWDEVDKVGTSKHNGSAVDALLPLLELDQARRYRDLALEVEVDLSGVSNFATANDIDAVPVALRDRFRILAMPEPSWQHLGVLTRQIVDRIAAERGIDPRFFGDLAEDELDLIKQAWPSGSIRQLTRIVSTIIDGRDQLLARC